MWKKLLTNFRYLLLITLLAVGGSSLVLLLAEDSNSNTPANGSLIKSADSPHVYYVGADGRKYPFPNEATYFSWYHNFALVQNVSQTVIDSLTTGPNLTIRPGIRFVKFSDSSQVYAVEPGGVLRWIPDEQMFHRLGYNFDHLIELPPSLRADYVMGETLTGPANGSVIRQGQFGSIFFVEDGKLLPTTLRGMEANRYFPHHIRITDFELTANLTRGDVVISFNPFVSGRPDQRWNPISADESQLNPQQPEEEEEILPPEEESNTDVPAPNNFSASGGAVYVQVYWQTVGGQDVTGYMLYRSTAPITDLSNSNVRLLGTISPSINYYLDSAGDLNELTTYYYAIRSVTSDNRYSALRTASAMTLASSNGENQPTAPEAPTNFNAVGGEQRIDLSWNLSISSGVTNYLLYRSLSPITNVSHNGVTQLASLDPDDISYTDNSVSVGTTYYYALRVLANNLYSSIVTASATPSTAVAQLDRILHLPEPPDNYVNPDALTWSKNAATMAAALGINKLMVPTRYYQGVNDLDPSYGSQACINHVGRFCGDYHEFLDHVDGLSTPDGRPVEVILLSAKVTKTPMTGDPQLKGAIRLQQMGEQPYDFFSRLSQTSGTLPPGGQGENRAFISINFSAPEERDRLLRMTTNISGDSVRIRWFPTAWGDAKFVDSGVGQAGLGLKNWDLPNPTIGANNQYLLMIQNTGTGTLTWEITGFTETTPGPSTIRNQDANYFEWLGNSVGFTTYGYNHPRYALNETRTRFINTMATVWNEFSNHPSLIGLMGYGDEPHAMFWMPEDTANFQNAGHQLAEFEKAVANGQYAFTQSNFLLFGDPRDPTHNGISSGVYASNMAGGGFSNMASYFNGSEPIDWVLWAGAHSTSQISGFTSQGFGVYLMQALYESNYASEFGRWVTAANGLSASEKERIKGWFYYTEQRSSVTQEILQSAVNATPPQL